MVSKHQILQNSISKKINQPMGRGGPMDMSTFRKHLEQGKQRTMASFSNLQPRQQQPSQQTPKNLSFSSKQGMRTDRHNNPTAMTTAVAANSGLVLGQDYEQGDPFSGGDGRVYYTARFLRDPIVTSIKALDNGGFYTQSGKPRWTYTKSLQGIQNWPNLNYNQKAAIVKQMYQHEGGNGSLMAYAPTPTAPQYKTPILNQLGNLTTTFGEKTRDTAAHRGIDVANKAGTPIPKVVPTPGKVSFVGANGDYGNTVQIQNPSGTKESYSHLQSANVQPGQTVQPGQQIGLMGSTGNSWSPTGSDPSHLHVEISDTYNRLVNPLNYFS